MQKIRWNALARFLFVSKSIDGRNYLDFLALFVDVWLYRAHLGKQVKTRSSSILTSTIVIIVGGKCHFDDRRKSSEIHYNEIGILQAFFHLSHFWLDINLTPIFLEEEAFDIFLCILDCS